MFDNIQFGPIPVCTKEQTKDIHYKALLGYNYIPLVHIPIETLSKEDKMYLGEPGQQHPGTTGIILTIHYLNPYS